MQMCGMTHLADARQHVSAELEVAVDFGLGAGHADVALIDEQRAGPW